MGDTAYVTGTSSLYVCTNATFPGVTWEVLGNIAGTIAATEVAFGTGTDTIDGSADLTWDDTNKTLTVTGDANPALVIASAIDGAFLQVTPTTRELAITNPLTPTDATVVSPTDVAVSNGTQSGNVAAGQVGVTDTGSTNTLRASIPGGVATITSENGTAVPQPLDLEIGELQINTDPGAVGEVLTSNGPGAAPTWQAGGGGGGITQLTQDVLAGPGSGSQAATVKGMGGATSKTLFVIEGGKFATVQAAINAASDYDVILVGPKASGASWGPAVFPSQKRLSLVGLGPKVGELPKIDSVTYSPTSGLNINENTVYVRGLMITGDFSSTPGVTFSGTFLGRLRIQECYIFSTGSSGSSVLNSNGATSVNASSSLYIDNCTIQASTSGAGIIGLNQTAGYTIMKNGCEISRGQYAIQCAAGTVEVYNAILDCTGIANEVIRITGGFVSVAYSTIRNTTTNASGVNLTQASTSFAMGDASFTIGTGTGYAVNGPAVAPSPLTPAAYVYANVSYSNTGVPGGLYNTSIRNTVTAFAITQQAATGDLSGNYPAPVVAQIQGKAVSSTAPTTGQVLVWNGTAWTPTAPAAVAASGVIDFALNGSSPASTSTFIGAVYIPGSASRTLAAGSRAYLGVSGANQSVTLTLQTTAGATVATFQNASATGFVDVLIQGTPTLAVGWYNIVLTAGATLGMTAFARGLYLTV